MIGIYESEPYNTRKARQEAFGSYSMLMADKLDNDGHLDPIEKHERVNFQSNLFPKKKVKKRRKVSDDLERKKTRFKSLDLVGNRKPDRSFLARKKARKRIMKRVHEQNLFLDYDSPYAEYLPALYKEWMPKEHKKVDNSLLNPNASRMDRIDEVSNVYKFEQPRSVNNSVSILLWQKGLCKRILSDKKK
jgi:hypothetical protein